MEAGDISANTVFLRGICTIFGEGWDLEDALKNETIRKAEASRLASLVGSLPCPRRIDFCQSPSICPELAWKNLPQRRKRMQLDLAGILTDLCKYL